MEDPVLIKLGIVMCVAGCAATPVAPAPPAVVSVTQDVQICGAAGAFHLGEQVRFTRRACQTLSPKSSVLRCGDADVDRGEVVRLVDERCAAVRLAAGSAVRGSDQWVAATP
jgi:hypothetical protein